MAPGRQCQPLGPESTPNQQSDSAPGHGGTSQQTMTNCFPTPRPRGAEGKQAGWSRDTSSGPQACEVCARSAGLRLQIEALEGSWPPGLDPQRRPRCNRLAARRGGSPGRTHCRLSPLLSPSTPSAGPVQVSLRHSPAPGSWQPAEMPSEAQILFGV